MDNIQLAASAAALAQGTEIAQGKQFIEISVAPELLVSTATALKENNETRFDVLVCITGMDWGKELGVVYHLRSTLYNHMIVLKTKVPDRENPELDSLCSLWPAANFHEREVYDLLGIKFRGHPDLRRLFLDTTWGYPLRKDYEDDINILSR